jgi:hypothetical protein
MHLSPSVYRLSSHHHDFCWLIFIIRIFVVLVYTDTDTGTEQRRVSELMLWPTKCCACGHVTCTSNVIVSVSLGPSNESILSDKVSMCIADGDMTCGFALCPVLWPSGVLSHGSSSSRGEGHDDE